MESQDGAARRGTRFVAATAVAASLGAISLGAQAGLSPGAGAAAPAIKSLADAHLGCSGVDGEGYWQVSASGGVFTNGAAAFYGSEGGANSTSRSSGSHPVSMVVGTGSWRPTVASSPSATRRLRDRPGRSTSTHRSSASCPRPMARATGSWRSDGGVFAFGDAAFYGSEGGTKLNQPIVGMAATKDGRGYWLVAADGGVFTFGDAPFYGSLGAKALNAPIAAIAPARNGNGYVLAAGDGGVFTFGASGFYGSAAGQTTAPVTGVTGTFFGNGYTLDHLERERLQLRRLLVLRRVGERQYEQPDRGSGVLLRMRTTLHTTLIDSIHPPSQGAEHA